MAEDILANVMKAVFMVVGCVFAVIATYVTVTDYTNALQEFTEPWMIASLVNFYIIVLTVGLWIIHKESNWIHSVIWIISYMLLGCMISCGYIVLQLQKLSPQESKQDPISFVLLSKKKNERRSKSILYVVSAKVLFSALGCLMIGTLIYTTITFGSPFRRDIFNPMLTTLLIDLYINIVILSVWIAYKEASWKIAVMWIVLLFCFESVAICAYIVVQLSCLSRQDPIFLILFNDRFVQDKKWE